LKRPWKEILQDYQFLFPIALAVIVLDQLTKAVVLANLPLGASWLPEWLSWLSPYARFLHWTNTGAAFGSFQGGNDIIKVLAVIVILLIIGYFPSVPRTERLVRVALSLQLGGAAGNLIDRLRFGHVVDFISVGTFPVFNVADSAISVGTGLLLLGMLLFELAERRARKAAVKEESGE